PSISHSTLPPLPSSTDRKIHTWGFVHFHCVTVPLSTTTLSGLNAELLWCARADVAAISTAMTKEQVLMCDPPRWRDDISTEMGAPCSGSFSPCGTGCPIGVNIDNMIGVNIDHISVLPD